MDFIKTIINSIKCWVRKEIKKHAESPHVTSINGMSGVLTLDDIGAQPIGDYALESDIMDLRNELEQNGSISWDDLEDKPFSAEREYLELNYDEEHEYNVTLQSGEKLYYVREMWDLPDIKYVAKVLPYATQEVSIEPESFEIPGAIDGYEHWWVTGIRFTIMDEVYTTYNIDVLAVPTDNLTFEYEGETLTLNHGWYLKGYAGYCYVGSLITEIVSPIDNKYLEIGQLVYDNIVENRNILYMDGYDEQHCSIDSSSECSFEDVVEILTNEYQYTINIFLGWANIDGVMSMIQQIAYDSDNDIIKLAPYGYSLDTKYFKWTRDGEVMLVINDSNKDTVMATDDGAGNVTVSFDG